MLRQSMYVTMHTFVMYVCEYVYVCAQVCMWPCVCVHILCVHMYASCCKYVHIQVAYK